MESKIDELLRKSSSQENVTGALIANNQGLCYGTRGEASANSAGFLTALVEQASKLHPNSNAPILVLETADREIEVSKYGITTAAIYKKKKSFKK